MAYPDYFDDSDEAERTRAAHRRAQSDRLAALPPFASIAAWLAILHDNRIEE